MSERSQSNSNKTLLHDIIAALVSHWGFHEVSASLSAFAEREKEGSLKPNVIRGSKSKLSPTGMIRRLETSVEKKALLSQIAQEFEEKKILPTAGHVQNFLTMRGAQAVLLKSRGDSFRALLRLLITLSEDELTEILSSHAGSGPTRLAPLSEAIESASRIIRGSETGPDKSDQEKGQP